MSVNFGKFQKGIVYVPSDCDCPGYYIKKEGEFSIQQVEKGVGNVTKSVDQLEDKESPK